MTEETGKTVPMDHRTTLFYKGVAAGNEIEEQHAETEFPDFDTKVKAFFFYGGAIAAGEHKITEAADFGYFMEGLVLRAPKPPTTVTVDDEEHEVVLMVCEGTNTGDLIVYDGAPGEGNLVGVFPNDNNGRLNLLGCLPEGRP